MCQIHIPVPGQDDRKPKRQKKMSKAQLLEEVEKKAADKEKLAASGTGKVKTFS